eukprot:774217-Pelagomonas_calceolata.AAC.9
MTQAHKRALPHLAAIVGSAASSTLVLYDKNDTGTRARTASPGGDMTQAHERALPHLAALMGPAASSTLVLYDKSDTGTRARTASSCGAHERALPHLAAIVGPAAVPTAWTGAWSSWSGLCKCKHVCVHQCLIHS